MAQEVKVFAIPNDLSLALISHKGEKTTSESFPLTSTGALCHKHA